MEVLFEQINVELEEKNALMEEIKDQIKDIKNLTRVFSFKRAKIHTILDQPDSFTSVVDIKGTYLELLLPEGTSPLASLPHIVSFASDTLLSLQQLKPVWDQLLPLVLKTGTVEQYANLWSYNLVELASGACFFTYILTGTIPSREQLHDILCLNDGMKLPLEDYLSCVVTLPAELVRLATNGVRNNMYGLPKTISKFVEELSNGLRLLDLKNGDLRRKFDAVKYSVSQLENMIFELHIRNIKTQE